MKKIATAFLILVCLSALAAPSYWFSQWEVKPDAKQAAAFFIVPGQGVFFTYQTNRVIINATGGGGGGGITTNLCVTTCSGTTNVLSFSNGVLVAVSGPPPPSGNFLIQPAGLGFLLMPGGGKILLP